MASIEEKRTPMAWQHRDMNYHQGPYGNERFNPGMDYPVARTGPPSTSDRLSHRTDKSWRTKESQPNHRGAATPGSASGYSREPSGSHYTPSRPSYSSGRPTSRPQSSGTTTESTSSSEDETATEDTRVGRGGPPLSLQPQSLYGYGPGYNPQYPGPMPVPGFPPPPMNGYPGTIKSSKSVPAIAGGTWNGEPCPVHGAIGPFSMPGPMPPPPHMLGPAPLYGQVGHPSLPPQMGPRRAASIYDMRNQSMIYGSLPPPRPAGDRRSLVGGPLSADLHSIPAQFLPPMARPRPVVVSEDGTAEHLPVRTPPEKNGSIAGMISKMSREENLKKKHKCTKGASCVCWTIISVIFMGVVIGVMLSFIL